MVGESVKESGGLTSVGTEVTETSTRYADTYPRDEFDVDVVPGQRRGAHRVAAPAIVSALPWILIGLFALACIVALITVYGGFGRDEAAPKPKATPSPTASAPASPAPAPAPEIDKGVQLLLLNGTPRSSLTDSIATKLRDDGWIVASTGRNDDRQVPTTFVVYKDPTLKPTAEALATFLGGGNIQNDPNLPEDMRVVLGRNAYGG